MSDRIVLDDVDEVSLGAPLSRTRPGRRTDRDRVRLHPLTIALEGGEGAVAFGPAGTAIIRVEKVEAADV